MAKKTFKPGQGYTKKDWDEVGDSPEITAEEFAQMRPFAEVFPDLAASIKKAHAPKQPVKKLVSLRLSGEVIDKYKAGGDGWQSRIDADLRKLNKIK
jgi:uncharacterized protein (DUF4415 family)